jgi:hypothetical protein
MAMDNECECSEEYGPCERHGDVLVTREGASCRTADELCMVLIDDLICLHKAELSPAGTEVWLEASAAFAKGERWLSDPDLSEALSDLAFQVENNANDVMVFHNDGYTIVKPHAEYFQIMGWE